MKQMNPMKYLCGLAVVLLLSACGGGSPESISAGNPPPPAKATSIAISLANSAGADVSSIALDGGYTVKAKVTDEAGKPVAGKALTFSISGSSIAVLTPGTALTNASGEASVAIAPSSVTSVGAASVAVSGEVGGTPVSASRDFAVQSADIGLSPLRVGSATLNSGGNTSVAVTALLGGSPAIGTPVNVSFSASCGRINSGVGSVTTDGSGVASAVYTAVQADGSPCSGSTTLSATTAGAAAVATSVNVAAPTATAITFVSSSLPQVFIAGSGAVEQAQVTFKVVSASLAPLANQSVVFSIVTNPGGVGLNGSGSTAPVTATTNSTGEASVSVFAGTIPGPVKVRAALPGTSIFAESQNLTVASGPPSQRFFSLAVETFNLEGANRDGVATKLTVRAADRQGNAVEDGTVINFTSEGGQVARSCATQRVANIASCSVDFVTQDFRPADGRVSVLAYAEGTKDYVDNNGNNRFDAGDTLIQMGDAYRDDNENGSFDTGEFFLPRSTSTTGNGVSCAGAGGAAPSKAGLCDLGLSTTVRKQTVILFASTQPTAPVYTRTASGVTFRLASRDHPLLPMPAGTIVKASVLDNTTDGATCSVSSVFGSPVANVMPGSNPNADLSTGVTVNLKDCNAGETLTIQVVSPSGLETTLPPYVLP